MGILGCIALIICGILGIWLAYMYFWRGENYKGEKITSANPVKILMGMEPIPKIQDDGGSKGVPLK
mgnify:CR=1 FL=1